MSSINREQASKVHKSSQQTKIVNRQKLIEEIETSTLEGLDATDINYYAGELGIEPNEVRQIYLKANPKINGSALLNTFINDETDEIFGFY